jgi:NADH dehydrogenase FAD-containing subunit
VAVKRLVLVGAGHINVALLSKSASLVDEGHEVVVVNPGPWQHYSGMGPGMLGGSYEIDEIRFPVATIARSVGARLVEDSVALIDAAGSELVLSGGNRLQFDVLSINTGSETAFLRPEAGAHSDTLPALYTSKPIEQLYDLRRVLEDRGKSESLRVVIAGGGPAAVELAGNVARVLRTAQSPRYQTTHSVTMVTGNTLLPGFPRRAARLVRTALERQGVAIRQGDRVVERTHGGVVCTHGTLPADLLVAATGVVPSVLMTRSGLPTGRDGGVEVDEFLQVTGQSRIFAGGDCICFAPRPLPRVGVYAVRETPVLVQNVFASMRGVTERSRFVPQRNYLLLMNLGDDTALLVRTVLGFPVILSGRWVWRLKDRIDRAFMSAYGSEREWRQEREMS